MMLSSDEDDDDDDFDHGGDGDLNRFNHSKTKQKNYSQQSSIKIVQAAKDFKPKWISNHVSIKFDSPRFQAVASLTEPGLGSDWYACNSPQVLRSTR